MQTEDSHPHEVLPGASARFPFWPSSFSGRVDVKCTLTGTGVPFELVLSGIQPWGWAATRTGGQLTDAEFLVDIEGTVDGLGRTDVFYEFINRSSSDLLWHQCYNN